MLFLLNSTVYLRHIFSKSSHFNEGIAATSLFLEAGISVFMKSFQRAFCLVICRLKIPFLLSSSPKGALFSVKVSEGFLKTTKKPVVTQQWDSVHLTHLCMKEIVFLQIVIRIMWNNDLKNQLKHFLIVRYRNSYKMCHTSLHQRALFLLWLIISLAEILAEIKGKIISLSKNNVLICTQERKNIPRMRYYNPRVILFSRPNRCGLYSRVGSINWQ